MKSTTVQILYHLTLLYHSHRVQYTRICLILLFHIVRLADDVTFTENLALLGCAIFFVRVALLFSDMSAPFAIPKTLVNEQAQTPFVRFVAFHVDPFSQYDTSLCDGKLVGMKRFVRSIGLHEAPLCL